MRGFRLRASVDAAKLERARTRCATCVRSFVCRASVAHTHTAAHQCARRARSVASSALPSFDRVLCCRARQPEPTHTRARVNQRTGSWNEDTACRQPAREEPAALCARVFGLAPVSTPRNWNEPERAACVRRIDVGCAVGFATRTTRQLTGAAAATNQCARRAMGASRRRRCRARPSALSPATLIRQTDPTRPDPTSRRAPTGSWREATACLAGSAAQRPPPAQAEKRPREFNESSQTIERPAALGERASSCPCRLLARVSGDPDRVGGSHKAHSRHPSVDGRS